MRKKRKRERERDRKIVVQIRHFTTVYLSQIIWFTCTGEGWAFSLKMWKMLDETEQSDQSNQPNSSWRAFMCAVLCVCEVRTYVRVCMVWCERGLKVKKYRNFKWLRMNLKKHVSIWSSFETHMSVKIWDRTVLCYKPKHFSMRPQPRMNENKNRYFSLSAVAVRHEREKEKFRLGHFRSHSHSFEWTLLYITTSVKFNFSVNFN